MFGPFTSQLQTYQPIQSQKFLTGAGISGTVTVIDGIAGADPPVAPCLKNNMTCRGF